MILSNLWILFFYYG